MPVLNTIQAELYQRLQDFKLDDPTDEFGFTRHLMKNNGWTLDYTQRAIAEYKKFVFLTVVADRQVVPSDRVDQVWHSHILLTQSYWSEFCPKVLGKKLHHHPARGGKQERAEFHDLYRQTMASYQYFFGSPPADIWSPPDIRFGKELKMQRVSLSDCWIIPKQLPKIQFTGLLSSLAVVVTILLIASSVSANQGADLAKSINDETRFIVYGMSIIIGLKLRYEISKPGKQADKPQLNIYEAAYLAGGSQRAIETAIAQLVHQGYLLPNVNNRTFAIAKRLNPEAAYLEQQIMQQVERTPEFKYLRQRYHYNTHFPKEHLEQKKLLISGWLGSILNSWGLFLGIAVVSLIFGDFLLYGTTINSRVENINIVVLVWQLVSQAIVIICLWSIVPGGRTRWGNLILANIQKNHNAYDVILRFALFGYEVLSGGALDDLKQIHQLQKQEEAAGGCGC